MPAPAWNKIIQRPTLIITEKPSVAREISLVLKCQKKHNHFFHPSGITITWVYGHLLELLEPHEYDKKWSNWDLSNLPILPDHFLLKPTKNASANQQLKFVLKAMQETTNIIAATDAGREGELIFRNLLDFKPVKNKSIYRLWISSLTHESIEKGLNSLFDYQDFDHLYAAAKSRSIADWLVGLNATRVLTLSFRHIHPLWTVGRVQTPTLALIVERDLIRKNFIVQTYFELRTNYKDIEFKHQEKYNEKQKAFNDLEFLKDEILRIEDIQHKKEKIYPPRPFDLNQLQQEMNHQLGLSAEQTLQIAQKLYESKYITYPRTDSQYLTQDMKSTILPLIEKITSAFSHWAKDIPKPFIIPERIFKNEKVTDHHAIIPTNIIKNTQGLNSHENIVYETIIKRFMALFFPPCEKSITKISARIKDKIFTTSGTTILKPGFTTLYPKKNTNTSQESLPLFIKNESGAHKIFIKELKTSPPLEYNDASLLQAMENADKEKGLGKLGTSATRANIIENLIFRKYIERKAKSLISTNLGLQLIKLIKLEDVKGAQLTGIWEDKLQAMEKGEYDQHLFLKEIKDYVRKFPNDLPVNFSIKNNSPFIGPCPNKILQCKGQIIKGNQSYGCNQWKENNCTQRFPFIFENTRITEEVLSEILHLGKSQKLYDCKNIVLEERNQQFSLQFTDRPLPLADSIGECLNCGHALMENPKAYYCSQWRSGCTFTIWKKMASKTIPKAQIRNLLKNKSTNLINGLKSRQGKEFQAKIVWKDNKITFDFSK